MYTPAVRLLVQCLIKTATSYVQVHILTSPSSPRTHTEPYTKHQLPSSSAAFVMGLSPCSTTHVTQQRGGVEPLAVSSVDVHVTQRWGGFEPRSISNEYLPVNPLVLVAQFVNSLDSFASSSSTSSRRRHGPRLPSSSLLDPVRVHVLGEPLHRRCAEG